MCTLYTSVGSDYVEVQGLGCSKFVGLRFSFGVEDLLIPSSVFESWEGLIFKKEISFGGLKVSQPEK